MSNSINSITPWLSNKQIGKWRATAPRPRDCGETAEHYISRIAAEFGYNVRMLECADEAKAAADAELEACCEWIKSQFHGYPTWPDALRAARRPKPISEKEQAITAMRYMLAGTVVSEDDQRLVIKLLESLPDPQS